MKSTIEARPPESIPFLGDEITQAGEVFGAGGAAVEVRAHTGNPRVGRGTGERHLDVAVELLEALLAGQLRGGGAKDPAQDRIALVVAFHPSSSLSAPTWKPRAASAARSLRRASCRLL